MSVLCTGLNIQTHSIPDFVTHSEKKHEKGTKTVPLGTILENGVFFFFLDKKCTIVHPHKKKMKQCGQPT